MINRQITYERDIHNSYMKIPSVQEACYDERIMFRKSFEGIIPMEKCYVNGNAQYWYNISGKQALDAYCRVNTVDKNLFETLILRICEQLELMEWNLLNSNCLVLEPELIFLNGRGDDVSFVLYPQNRGNLLEELRQLLEFLLSKLNHKETEGVQGAYELYEMTLSENYNIFDLRSRILERRMKDKTPEDVDKRNYILDMEKKTSVTHLEDADQIEETVNKSDAIPLLEKLAGLYHKTIEILSSKPEELFAYKRDSKEEIPDVVYPEDVEEKIELEIHPTICLAATLGEPRGILIYEGIGAYPDFEIGQMICVIGKSHRARLCIERETVSNFHAKIDFVNGNYYIEDMNSTNGTFLNEEIVNYKEKKLLTPGDVLRFADVKYRFL